MAKNKSAMITEATRLLLQTSSKVFYRGLSEAAKDSVRVNFFAADKQGLGRISFRDFLDSGLNVHLQDPARLGLFRFLDADGTGFLELDEFIMLHYINESGTFYCSSCGIPIIIGGYSCINCPPPGPNSFDICLSCYASPTPAFMHHHPQTSFVNLVANFQQSRTFCNSTMPINNMTRGAGAAHIIDESGLIFQCDCCGVNIVTDRYTCKDCVNSFDLCLSCYSSYPPPQFRHHHPYTSFIRKDQSQAAAEAAAATAMINAMNIDIMASAAARNAMSASAASATINAMNADIAAAAARNAMSAMNSTGHFNQYYGQQLPVQEGYSKIEAGLNFLGKVVDFSTQTGLFN